MRGSRVGAAAAAAGAPVLRRSDGQPIWSAISLCMLRSTIASRPLLCPSAGEERAPPERVREKTGAFWGVGNSERVPIRGESPRPEKASRKTSHLPYTVVHNAYS